MWRAGLPPEKFKTRARAPPRRDLIASIHFATRRRFGNSCFESHTTRECPRSVRSPRPHRPREVAARSNTLENHLVKHRVQLLRPSRCPGISPLLRCGTLGQRKPGTLELELLVTEHGVPAAGWSREWRWNRSRASWATGNGIHTARWEKNRCRIEINLRRI